MFTFISKFLVSLGNKLLSLLATGVTGLTPVFIAAAMIGMFIIMAGNKKLGTKVTSISVLIYVIVRVVL